MCLIVTVLLSGRVTLCLKNRKLNLEHFTFHYHCVLECHSSDSIFSPFPEILYSRIFSFSRIVRLLETGFTQRHRKRELLMYSMIGLCNAEIGIPKRTTALPLGDIIGCFLIYLTGTWLSIIAHTIIICYSLLNKASGEQ